MSKQKPVPEGRDAVWWLRSGSGPASPDQSRRGSSRRVFREKDCPQVVGDCPWGRKGWKGFSFLLG